MMEIRESLEFGARALALRSTPSQTREEILKLQRKRLEELVQHARENSKHYQKKYSRLPESGYELTDIPTSSKPEIMDHFKESLTVDDVHRDEVEAFFEDEDNLGQYYQDKYVLSHTSGSQGQPLFIVQPKESIELLFALQVARGNHKDLSVWQVVKHLVASARLAAIILKRGFYPSACAFEYMPEGAKAYMEVKHLALTDGDLAKRLAEFQPTHLTAYASVLHDLARQMEEGTLDLKPELQQVVNISERLMPQAREHYSEVFGAPILDNYSMGECLFLTNGCPETGMHINADWCILEVVDDDNKPMPDGTKGAKVLITNLANYVQPIIRYEIGDIVTMAKDQCGCGNNMPRIESVEGRDSDVFWVHGEEGMRSLSPAVFEIPLAEVAEVREYQLVQEKLDSFKIRVEPLPSSHVNGDQIHRKLQDSLKDLNLKERVKFAVEVVDQLTTENGDKFKRVATKIGPDGKPVEEKSKAKGTGQDSRSNKPQSVTAN